MNDEAKLAVQARLADATRRGDAEAMVALGSADAVVWHNDDEVAMPIATSGRRLRGMHRVVPDLVWEDVAVVPTANGFVWQAFITGSAPGGPLRVHTCAVVTLNHDGQVVRIDEYLDSAATRVFATPSA